MLYTYSVPQPPYLVGTMLANVGDLSNKGVELTLNGNIISTNDFTWDANVSMAMNKQVIDRLSNENFETDAVYSGALHGLDGMSGQYSQIISEGYPVGTFWGPLCSGLDSTGQFIFENEGEPQDIGNVQPKLSFGFGTSLSYKNFDLELSAYGMLGQKVLNATAMSLHNPNRLPALNVMDSFIDSGISDNMTYSSYWIEDASFLRLQSATLGYTFNMNNMGISRLRLYATGENLFVLTNYSGTDPEVSIEGLSGPGMDWFNAYPRPITFSFGLNVSF